MPNEPINGREPAFSEEDIQQEELGPRGVPGKESPAKMTPQAEKNTQKDPPTGYTKYSLPLDHDNDNREGQQQSNHDNYSGDEQLAHGRSGIAIGRRNSSVRFSSRTMIRFPLPASSGLSSAT